MNSKVFETIEVLFGSFIKIKWYWIIIWVLVNVIIFPAIKLIQPKTLTYIFESLLNYKENKSFFDLNIQYY